MKGSSIVGLPSFVSSCSGPRPRAAGDAAQQRRTEWSALSLTQPPRYLVERKAFRARDGLALIAMAGRTEKEKLTTGAGIEALARRLSQRGKAVVLEDDLREACVERRPHNRLLPRRHRG